MEALFHTVLTFLLVAIHTVPPLAGSFPISSNFPAVFNFGDSNSDTGELTSGLGFHLRPPNGQTYVFKPPSSGRFCNGRLIVDFLSNSSFLTPFFSFSFIHDFFFFLSNNFTKSVIIRLYIYNFTECTTEELS